MANKKPREVDITTFKKSINNMISTSTSAYNGDRNFRKGMSICHYSEEEILEIIESGDPAQLREASLFFSYASGFYRRFLIYYATLLYYSYLLIPHMRNSKKSIEDEKIFNNYKNATEFMSSLKLKNLSKHIAIRVLTEGSYYGILRDFSEDGIAVQDLPFSYCRSRFKNQSNVDIVELKLTYFDSIREKKVRDEVLKSYPKDVRLAYNRFKNSSGPEWYVLEPGQGLYFNIMDERPFFSSVLPAIIDFKDYRKMEKEKDGQDLKSLLIQKLPIEDGELVFDPEEAEEIHRGSVEMMKNNKYTDVLTTFANVSLEDMESNRSVVTNNLQKIESSIYSEAGVSKQIFAAEGNIALQKSITNDIALMMILAEKIANWANFLINEKFADKNLTYKVVALPYSYYNEADMRKDTLSLAQSGYSFILPLLTLNLEQSDLIDLKELEIKALKLDKIMIPLASSFTTSSKQTGGGTNAEAGGDAAKEVIEKPEDQKTQKTIENIEAQS